jgi:hypothetical protein
MARTAKTKAAIGFRAHSGWAAMVAVGGDPNLPEVIDRRRVELADPAVPGFPQPYHAAERLQLKEAEDLIGGCVDAAGRMARESLVSVVGELTEAGYKPLGCGLLLSSGRLPVTLAGILASHTMIHTAEGELFRDALAQASRHCKLPLTGIKERELFDRAASALDLSLDDIQLHLAEMGRPIGPPWRQDEKLAALVAWLVLVP